MLPFKKSIIVFLSVLLGIFIIFFAYTYYLMQTSNGTHLIMLVNTKEELIGEKIRSDFPIHGENDITYKYPVVFEKVLETDSEYRFTISPTVFPRDQVRGDKFEYALSKEKYIGDIELKDIEVVSKININLKYDLSKNIRYFLEYSLCTVKKAYSDLFKLDTSCGRGDCDVKRKIMSWDVDTTTSTVQGKVEYFDSVNKVELKKKLINFFLTDDFGYFNPNAFRYVSTQLSKDDGTFSFSTESVISEETGKNSTPSIFWLLAGVSQDIKRQDINVEGYMSTISGYLNKETYGDAYFLNCTASKYIVNNLSECTSTECVDVKEKAFKYCEDTIGKAIEKYDTTAASFTRYTTKSILRGYLFGISSEMIKYNQLAEKLNKTPKYSQADIMSFYNKGKNILGESDQILPICYQLRSARDINSVYPGTTVLSDMETLSTKISSLPTLCDGDPRNTYCEVSISEQLLCVDALIDFKDMEAKNILSDIFFRYYFESPGSTNIVTYENFRDSILSKENPNKYLKLEEYGYFNHRAEKKGFIANSAQLTDSYFFVNLLDLFNND